MWIYQLDNGLQFCLGHCSFMNEQAWWRRPHFFERPHRLLSSKSLNTPKFRSHSLYISDVVSLTPEPQATSVKLLDRGKRQGQDIIPSPIFMLVLVHFMIASRTQPLQSDKTQHPRVFSSKGYFLVFIFRVRIKGMGDPYIPIHRCVKSPHILYTSRSMDTCLKKKILK